MMKQQFEFALISHNSNDAAKGPIDTPANNLMQLRFDWTRLERLSPLAKQIENMQTDCSITKKGLFWFRNFAGLGSEIHSYSMALCFALELKNVRVHSIAPFVWRDELHCSDSDGVTSEEKISPIKCYFPEADRLCPGDEGDTFNSRNLTDPDGRIARNLCPSVVKSAGGFPGIRAATTEFLFTRVSDLVQKEAQRQMQILFGKNTKANGQVPKNLITVHVRWGDKNVEIGLKPIADYITAVQTIVDSRRGECVNQSSANNCDEVNILLATEDPEALKQFTKKMPKHWNVYVDQYYLEYLPYRLKTGNAYNAHVDNVKATKGHFGLVALGSLLVAMEANDYVLTTGSS